MRIASIHEPLDSTYDLADVIRASHPCRVADELKLDDKVAADSIRDVRNGTHVWDVRIGNFLVREAVRLEHSGRGV